MVILGHGIIFSFFFLKLLYLIVKIKKTFMIYSNTGKLGLLLLLMVIQCSIKAKL